MKTVNVKLPFDEKSFLINGNENDVSILLAIEFCNNYYEPHIMNLLKKIIRSDSLCIDIGANIGIISLVLGHLSPGGKVYSFEPSMENHSYLMQNIKQSGLCNIEPIKLGIYDENKQVKFTHINEGSGWSFVDTVNRKAEVKDIINLIPVHHSVHEIINCIKLDDWMNVKQLNKLDFIKIDVEGAEVKALTGAVETMTRFRPDLVIEINPHTLEKIFGEKTENLYLLLKDLYTKIYCIHIDNSLTEIHDFSHLLEVLAKGRGVEEFYCTIN
jgi:FkbM family methyltransferase